MFGHVTTSHEIVLAIYFQNAFLNIYWCISEHGKLKRMLRQTLSNVLI